MPSICLPYPNNNLYQIQKDDIPKHDAKLEKLREFCLNKGLVVEAKEGKRGIPIRKDYSNSVKLYLQNCDEKYRAEAIVRSYGIRIIRLPPYHPELNPIGKLLLKEKY